MHPEQRRPAGWPRQAQEHAAGVPPGRPGRRGWCARRRRLPRLTAACLSLPRRRSSLPTCWLPSAATPPRPRPTSRRSCLLVRGRQHCWEGAGSSMAGARGPTAGQQWVGCAALALMRAAQLEAGADAAVAGALPPPTHCSHAAAHRHSLPAAAPQSASRPRPSACRSCWPSWRARTSTRRVQALPGLPWLPLAAACRQWWWCHR